MNENKTLLTQQEIDALINFLERHDDTPIGAVLDQSSIDKLIEIIKYNNSKGIFFGKGVSLDYGLSDSNAVIKDPDGNEINVSGFILDYIKNPDGYISVFCADKNSGTRITLSPSCLSEHSYVKDDACWGYTVSPGTLLKLSRMFNVNCSAQLLQKAEKDFAKVVYGDENAKIADYYTIY